MKTELADLPAKVQTIVDRLRLAVSIRDFDAARDAISDLREIVRHGNIVETRRQIQ